VHADPWLRRFERTSIAACLALAAAALAIARGAPGPAIGVLGGGLLSAVSYRTIAAGVNSLVDRLTPEDGEAGAERRQPRLAWMATQLALRYALLAVLAYVMIARLRLHPLGLLVGASSVVAAASVEALRLLLKK
jgi:ATP synthase I subunit